MKTKRLLSAALTLALLCSLLFVTAVPAAAASDLDSLKTALAAGGTVVLEADIEVPGGDYIYLPPGVAATLDLNGHTLGGGEFELEDCLLLVEGDLTLTDSAGGGALSAAYDCVYIIGGSFTMTGGVITDVGMAGVVLSGEAPRCVIDGGVIEGCRGTADEESGDHISGACVYVLSGSLELRGGTLRDSSYGIFLQGGSAEMSGGEISGIYSVLNPVNGYYDCGAGVTLLHDADFQMTGGVISGCEFSGIYLCGESSAKMSGGEIADGLDGVCLNGEETVFTLTDGSLHGFEGEVDTEESYCYYGAGIDIFSGSAEMAGGEIYDALYGIQTNNYGGNVAMSGGTIRDLWGLRADNGYWYGGDGIELCSGELTMTGGTVRDVACAGIRVWDDATAKVSGGSIGRCGGTSIGVEDGGALLLSGTPEMLDSEGIRLYGDSVVTLAGPLTNEAPYRIWSDRMGREETVRFTQGLAGNGGPESFLCYYRSWYDITADENGEAVLTYIPRCADVQCTDWFSAGVSYCMYYDILEAADGRFDPGGTLTRGDTLELLWRYDRSPEPDPETALPFTDVPADAPYATAIRHLVEIGIVRDDGDGLLCPDTPVTRQEFASLLYYLSQTYGYGYGEGWSFELPFSDAGEVIESAAEGVSWMVEYGVLRGMGDGTLDPGGSVTRAQAATMLLRLVEAFEDLGMYD